jgi:hypothetical protein
VVRVKRSEKEVHANTRSVTAARSLAYPAARRLSLPFDLPLDWKVQGKAMLPDHEPAPHPPASVTRDEVRRLTEAGAQLVEVLPRDEFDAQAAGLTLTEIRSILAIRDTGQPPCEHVTTLIHTHLDQIQQRITELQAARTALRDLARRAATTSPATCTSTDICRILIPPAPAPALP